MGWATLSGQVGLTRSRIGGPAFLHPHACLRVPGGEWLPSVGFPAPEIACRKPLWQNSNGQAAVTFGNCAKSALWVGQLG